MNLKIFQKMSGLKVNFQKTQLIWIGKKKYSTETIKTRWKIQWGSNRFKLLGIIFDTDLNKVNEINYKNKIELLKIKYTIGNADT